MACSSWPIGYIAPMKITLLAFLIFASSVHAVKLSETAVQTVTIETERSFKNEKDALEAAFMLEDLLHNRRSEEFGNLKKKCDHFIGLLKPTVVRLKTDENNNIKGIIQSRIRCLR